MWDGERKYCESWSHCKQRVIVTLTLAGSSGAHPLDATTLISFSVEVFGTNLTLNEEG